MAHGVALLTVDDIERLMRKGCLDLLDTHAPPDHLAVCRDANVDIRYPETTRRATCGGRLRRENRFPSSTASTP